MPVLARAWQMLLKGYDEVRSSPRPLAAADMVLVRLAYAADLPTPGDLMRRLGDAAGAGGERPAISRPSAPAPREPVAVARGEPAPVAPAEARD